jgi:hypothetical protein
MKFPIAPESIKAVVAWEKVLGFVVPPEYEPVEQMVMSLMMIRWR